MTERVLLQIHDSRVICEVARTPEAHALGLQKHASLSEGEGMFFAFDDVRTRTFHMADVEFPIDIIGVSSDLRISRIIANAKPGTSEVWAFPHVGAVLEVPGNFSRKARWKMGDHVNVVDWVSKLMEGDSGEDPRSRQIPQEQLENSTFNDEAKSEYFHELWPEELADSALDPQIDKPIMRHSRRAQIVDEAKFVDKVSTVLTTHAGALEWTPDVLNGGNSERAVVTRRELSRWLQAGQAAPESVQYIVQAASTDRGLSLIGDAAILAGMADFARVGFTPTGPMLVLYRGEG